ncbi:MAG: SRPBCC family protein [Chloroflexi bacterium]|nr:MAG: SRPBCC family protein [Chloroflexota bacterium]
MGRVEKSIEVNVPIRVAYDQWTQFEEFPRFMEWVKSVQQLDDTHLHWKAEIAGQQKDWDARIVAQRPDEMVAWTSTSGARNAGVVRFEPVSDDLTRITLEMDVDPDGPIENLGDFLGVIDQTVEGDLKRFKEFIESRGAPSGAWRGTIDGSSPSER